MRLKFIAEEGKFFFFFFILLGYSALVGVNAASKSSLV